MIRKSLPTSEGEGHIRFSGDGGPAYYWAEDDLVRLRTGAVRLRGRIRTTADLAMGAFRAGEALLTAEDGRRHRLTMVGHSAGAPDVFVEFRV